MIHAPRLVLSQLEWEKLGSLENKILLFYCFLSEFQSTHASQHNDNYKVFVLSGFGGGG